MLWLNRCGAFLIVFKICRTLDDLLRRSKLDEFNVAIDDDCCGCGFNDVTLLSKMVGIAVDVWPKPLLLLENKFNSLACDGVPLFVERRFRNDNDFKRLNLVDSCELPGTGATLCFCRSSNDETSWSNTFKSAFILEFRIAVALPLLARPFVDIPKRCVI